MFETVAAVVAKREDELQAQIAQAQAELKQAQEKARARIKKLRSELRQLKKLRKDAAKLHGSATVDSEVSENSDDKDPNSAEIDQVVDASTELWGTPLTEA